MTGDLVAAILARLTALLPPPPVALHEPSFTGNEWQYLKQCLDSGWVAVGEAVTRLEELVAAYTGIPQVVATSSGTAALHLALRLAGVEPGDEVLVPALSFVATANAVAYCGAVPHFIDCEEQTLGVDPAKLDRYLESVAIPLPTGCRNSKTKRRISAVVAMHTFGHPVNLAPLAELCRRWRLTLIEDAAEALGSLYQGNHVGVYGLLAALSFNGNKIVTTGGGGALLTRDEGLAQAARHLATQAKLSHRWRYDHDLIGYNYRMPNLNAALGCAQLVQLPQLLTRKRALARRYQESLADLKGVKIFTEADFARSNYWLNALILDREQSRLRDTLLEATHRQGIMTRPAWTPLHLLPPYRDCPRMDLSVAGDLEQRLINLPSSAHLLPDHE